MPPDKGKGKGKGKGKATHPSESSPLLGSSSRSNRTDHDQHLDRASTRSPILSPRIRSIIVSALIVLASLLISAILFLALLAFSFRPSPSELEALPKTAFRYTSPEEVKILNITEEGVLVNVTIRCGIDADRVFGVQGFSSNEEKAVASQLGKRGVGADWWEDLRRWTARMAINQLPSQAVEVNLSQRIFISPPHSTMPYVGLDSTTRTCTSHLQRFVVSSARSLRLAAARHFHCCRQTGRLNGRAMGICSAGLG